MLHGGVRSQIADGLPQVSCMHLEEWRISRGGTLFWGATRSDSQAPGLAFQTYLRSLLPRSLLPRSQLLPRTYMTLMNFQSGIPPSA